MYLLSLLKAKLEIYYYNEVRIQYSFLITSSMKRNIHSLISYNLEWLMICHQGLINIISFDGIFCFCGYLYIDNIADPEGFG